MVMSVSRAAYDDVAIEYGSRDVGMGRTQRIFDGVGCGVVEGACVRKTWWNIIFHEVRLRGGLVSVFLYVSRLGAGGQSFSRLRNRTGNFKICVKISLRCA